jgi:hypothetical protein
MAIYRHKDELKLDNVPNLSQGYIFLKRLTWPGPKETGCEGGRRFRVTLSLDAGQMEIVMSAVDKAKDLLNTDSTARALEHIAFDWFMECADLTELLPLEIVKGFIEKVYEVQLFIERKAKV